MTIPLIICGAFGRMGHFITELVKKDERFLIKALVVRPNSVNKKKSNKAQVFPCLRTALENTAGPSVILDFSLAALAKEHVAMASDYGARIVIGTTGIKDADLAHIKEHAVHIPILIAPNTSLMAHLLVAFCKMASTTLKDCEASIVDIHHREKKDAPSGTALLLQNAIGQKSLTDIHSIRKGKIIGEHTVYFFNDFERLELSHRVSDRLVFAEGALFAAQFLFRKEPGLYDMNDVLNLNLTIKNQS